MKSRSKRGGGGGGDKIQRGGRSGVWWLKMGRSNKFSGTGLVAKTEKGVAVEKEYALKTFKSLIRGGGLEDRC